MDVRFKKIEKEFVVKEVLGFGKEKLKVGVNGFVGGRGEAGSGYGRV